MFTNRKRLGVGPDDPASHQGVRLAARPDRPPVAKASPRDSQAERLSRSELKAQFRPEQVTAVVDTREQSPLDLSPLRATGKTLVAGDYSILGLESIVSVERKSLMDLVACTGAERGRFAREVRRLLGYPVRALVVEATWQQVEAGRWRARTKPRAVIGSLLGWMASG